MTTARAYTLHEIGKRPTLFLRGIVTAGGVAPESYVRGRGTKDDEA